MAALAAAALLSQSRATLAGDDVAPRTLATVAGSGRPVWTARRSAPAANGSLRSTRSVAFAPPPVLQATTAAPTAGRANDSSTVILKWRARRPATFGAASSTPAPLMRASVSDGFSPSTAARQPVRQAAQLKPLDPFEDPFGDRPFGDRSPPADDPAPLPPAAISLDPPAQAQDAQAQSRWPAAPLPLQSQFLSVQAAPSPSVPGAAGQAACDRVYNQRNCCDEDSKCAAARAHLEDNPVSSIVLDITPDCNAHSSQARVSRSWKDCSNQVVAVGSMTDYRNSRVVVSKADGTSVELLYGELSDDDLCFVAAWCGLPTECRFNAQCEVHDLDSSRLWASTTFTWTASALCHKPLYFEDVQLERYGHSAGPLLQPVLSGGHFFLNIAVLPYRMGINPPNECQYALGYYRPGSCAPWLIEPIPLSLRGGLMEAGAITGGILALP